MIIIKAIAGSCCLSFLLSSFAFGQPTQQKLSLTQEQASHFAGLALKCVRKEYPNKPDHTINDESDVRNPRAMHPSFYGCLDWHSTVHGHWMLVHLLRLFPNLPDQFLHGRTRARIERAECFVHQQHLRLHHERLRNRRRMCHHVRPFCGIAKPRRPADTPDAESSPHRRGDAEILKGFVANRGRHSLRETRLPYRSGLSGGPHPNPPA